MKRIAIIGGGSWGTALSIIAARKNHEVRLWSRNRGAVESINRSHYNSVHLSNSAVPETVRAATDLAETLDRAEFVLLAIPSHAMRSTLESMLPWLRADMIFVSATKGIEPETGLRISQIVQQTTKSQFEPRFVCLSGPSFAREVVEKHPTAVVAASSNAEDSCLVQAELSFDNLRIYTNGDVVGTELGGSVKNVMAIAAGMVAGLGFGTNSVAALITRGLAEMTRLALHEGAELETLMGLAGLGDLILTCTGALSRNRFVGEELGKGRRLEDITAGMKEVAEGVRTTEAVKRLARSSGVEMPITEEVYAVLYEGRTPQVAATELMTRPLREEFQHRYAGTI